MQVGPNEPQAQIETPLVQQPAGELLESSPAKPISLLERAKENPLLPSFLLLGGVMLMIVIMFRSLKKNHSTRARRDHATGSPADRIAEIHERAQSSMTPANKAMLDAEEITRRLSAQLDNKAARLELLLEEADAKLSELNRTLAGAERSVNRNAPARSPDPLYTGSTTEHLPAPRTLDPSLLDRARMDQDLAERGTTHAGPPSQATTGSAQDQINERILRLADDGLGCVEIARSLNQPVGQVELVLNLRKSS